MPKNDNEIMEALIYVRVSSGEQVTEGNSLVTQEKICRTKAEKLGLIPVIFREEGESAKTINRPKLKEMMVYAAKNKTHVDCIVLYRIDRLSRDVGDYLSLKRYFNGLHIRIVST